MNVRGDNLTISKKKTISSLERKRRRRGGGRKYQSANVRGGGGLAEEKEGGDGLSTKSSEKGEGLDSARTFRSKSQGGRSGERYPCI